MRSRRAWLLLAALGVLMVVSAWPLKPALAEPENAGSADPTFGSNGIVGSVWPPGVTSIADSAIQADGKIVTAGGLAYRDTGEEDFLVARYTIGGALDTSFGSEGKVGVRFGSGKSVGSALALQADGKLVVVGFVQNSGVYSVAVARLNGDGSLDSSFGSGGTVSPTLGGQSARGVGMALQPDGKILVAGTINDTLAVLRFNTNGALDGSFGAAGVVTTTVNTGEAGQSIATTVAVQPDGRILAAGGAERGGCLRGAITRYNTDGSPDNSFGNAGQVFYPRSYEFFKLAIQNDQKFLAASSTYNCDDSVASRGTIARFNADGSSDSSFAGGFRDLPDNSNSRVMAVDVLLAPDNSIWVAAFDSSAAFIAGLRSDGSMNERFGPNGIRRTAIEFSAATTISMQNDGKAIIGALKTQPNYGTYGLLGRYQTTVSCIFVDVCVNDFFYGAALYLTQHGVISGYNDGTFRPYANTTRGQMAKIVTLAFDLPRFTPPSGQTFVDVSPGSPFFEYIETLAHNNVASGESCGDGCVAFNPGADITRGQLAKIVSIAAGWQLQSPATPHFSDVPTDNPFYTYIETAVAQGVISGYANGTFGWTFSATRGQIAKIVHLSIEQVAQSRDKGVKEGKPSK